MIHDENTMATSPAADPPRPAYEPPVVVDYGTIAALTLGSGGIAGSDMWGASGAGGGTS